MDLCARSHSRWSIFEATDEGGEVKVAYYYAGDRRYYPFAFGLYVTFKYFADRLETHFFRRE